MLVTMGDERFWVQEQGEFFVEKDDDSVTLDEKAWAVTDTLALAAEERAVHTGEWVTAKACIQYLDRALEKTALDLYTPEGVKEALLSGKKLYNPETGEFFWQWDDEGSIAKVRAPSMIRGCLRPSSPPSST